MAEKPATPELDRQSALLDKANEVGRFIEWLNWEKKYEICAPQEGSRTGAFYPVNKSPLVLLEEFYEIDPMEIEKERRALLEWLRNELPEDEQERDYADEIIGGNSDEEF